MNGNRQIRHFCFIIVRRQYLVLMVPKGKRPDSCVLLRRHETATVTSEHVALGAAFLRHRPSLSCATIVQHSLELEVSLLASQGSSTGPYPEPHQLNSYYSLYYSKIYFNILPLMSSSFQWFLSFWFSAKFLYVFIYSHTCYIPSTSPPL